MIPGDASGEVVGVVAAVLLSAVLLSIGDNVTITPFSSLVAGPGPSLAGDRPAGFTVPYLFHRGQIGATINKKKQQSPGITWSQLDTAARLAPCPILKKSDNGKHGGRHSTPDIVRRDTVGPQHDHDADQVSATHSHAPGSTSDTAR
jgi:hypothetical protein